MKNDEPNGISDDPQMVIRKADLDRIHAFPAKLEDFRKESVEDRRDLRRGLEGVRGQVDSLRTEVGSLRTGFELINEALFGGRLMDGGIRKKVDTIIENQKENADKIENRFTALVNQRNSEAEIAKRIAEEKREEAERKLRRSQLRTSVLVTISTLLSILAVLGIFKPH